MALADALSVIGAVSGAIGAVLGTTSYVRDRPRILVLNTSGTWTEKDSDPQPFARQFVINAGRQPTTIIAIGITEIPSITRPWQRWQKGSLRHSRVNSLFGHPSEPLVLQPGEVRVYHYRPGMPYRSSKAQARSFVWDYRNRVIAARTIMTIPVGDIEITGSWYAASAPEDASEISGDFW
jgi:hypothetical protein